MKPKRVESKIASSSIYLACVRTTKTAPVIHTLAESVRRTVFQFCHSFSPRPIRFENVAVRKKKRFSNFMFVSINITNISLRMPCTEDSWYPSKWQKTRRVLPFSLRTAEFLKTISRNYWSILPGSFLAKCLRFSVQPVFSALCVHGSEFDSSASIAYGNERTPLSAINPKIKPFSLFFNRYSFDFNRPHERSERVCYQFVRERRHLKTTICERSESGRGNIFASMLILFVTSG